ncbi:MAG: hypothetical protein HMLKMBBP_01841 [Planctomycetes bacterium]|nr:hypothetical protein [Planctomycetota bacterium]
MSRTAARLLLLLGLAFAAAPSAEADDDGLTPFESPALDADGARRALNEHADALAADADLATKTLGVTVCSREPEDRRAALAREVGSAIRDARESLEKCGWSIPSAPTKLTVVHVRSAVAPALEVFSSDGASVFVRDGKGPAAPVAPSVPARADGPALERDLIAAYHRHRIWASEFAPAAGGWRAIAAERAARTFAPPETAPRWWSQALATWLERKLGGGKPPGHVCRSWNPPLPATLEALAAGDGGAPGAARGILGRMVGVLVDGRTDGGARFFAVGRGDGTLDARVRAATGQGLAELVAAAGAEPAGRPEGAQNPAAGPIECDDAGQISCPACFGKARVPVACDECSGVGATTCPSCHGLAWCSNCTGGLVYYRDGGFATCGLCKNGKLKCLACAGALKAPCKSCKGTGKLSPRCLACSAGKVACPGSWIPRTPEPCAWCGDRRLEAACKECRGVGHLGCTICSGTQRAPCMRCSGTGGRVTGAGGYVACHACDLAGWSRCAACKSGKLPCGACKGKGRGSPDPKDCLACAGAGTLPASDRSHLRPQTAPLTAEELKALDKAKADAVKFLLSCRSGEAFALRDLRRGTTDTAPSLDPPTPFSNAMVLLTLAAAGRGCDDPALRPAWDVLRRDANKLVVSRETFVGAQAVSLSLRALLMGGEDPKGPLVRGLTDRLVKSQRANGFWSGNLADPKDKAGAFDSLFVAEALRAARMKGVKVPSEVWSKLHRATTAELDGPSLSTKSDWLTGSGVASALALAVISKEGSLGSKATAYDYGSISGVKRGLAWLDRHFTVDHEPQFAGGAKRTDPSDRGYMAWLYSIQRLGMLLSIEDLGGERWYPRGVRHLLGVVYPDGSFEERSSGALNGSVRTTCGALLFLLRATPPITDSADGD